MVNEVSMGKKVASILMLAVGVVLFCRAMMLDFAGSKSDFRGEMLVIGVILVIAGLYFFPTLRYHRTIINIIFLFPLLFAFLVTVIIPLVLGVSYSFTDWDGMRMNNVVGLANYTKIFSQKDFIWSILITFMFVIFNMILVNLVAFLLALLCTSKLKGMGFFRAAYFLPNLIGGIVLGYIWKFVFSNVVTKITMALIKDSTSMLENFKTAFFAIIIVYVWQYAGYIMLIYITGLNTVPGDVIEAAAIDGASPMQTLFNIKIPMIAPTITICTFLTLTSAFKQFDVNLALTNGTPSADFAGEYITQGTSMLALNIFQTAVVKDNYPLGQSKAVLFFIILAIVSILQVRISNKKEVEL